MQVKSYKHSLDKFRSIIVSNYFYLTKSASTLVVLHGWNTKGLESWQEFLDQAKDLEVNILAIEMPAFGQSQDPSEVWGVFEYAEFLNQFINFKLSEVGLENTHKYLLGHSFGGAVSCLVAKEDVGYKGLFLLAPAIIRSQKENNIIKKTTKIFKKIFQLPVFRPGFNLAKKIWYKLLGSPDYVQVSGIKKEIMQKILRQDLSEQASKLNLPVTLFWGDRDKYTPYPQALELSKLIKNCSLVTYPGINHGLHLYASLEILKELKTTLYNSN